MVKLKLATLKPTALRITPRKRTVIQAHTGPAGGTP